MAAELRNIAGNDNAELEAHLLQIASTPTTSGNGGIRGILETRISISSG
jgi:hypothetical protein